MERSISAPTLEAVGRRSRSNSGSSLQAKRDRVLSNHHSRSRSLSKSDEGDGSTPGPYAGGWDARRRSPSPGKRAPPATSEEPAQSLEALEGQAAGLALEDADVMKRVLLPAGRPGSLGKALRTAQTITGATADYEDENRDKGGSEAWVVLRGPSSCVDTAEELLRTMMEGQSPDDVSLSSFVLTFELPNAMVKDIIASKGASISDVLEASGVKIRIPPGKASSPSRTVILEGEEEVVKKAAGVLQARGKTFEPPHGSDVAWDLGPEPTVTPAPQRPPPANSALSLDVGPCRYKGTGGLLFDDEKLIVTIYSPTPTPSDSKWDAVWK